MSTPPEETLQRILPRKPEACPHCGVPREVVYPRRYQCGSFWDEIGGACAQAPACRLLVAKDRRIHALEARLAEALQGKSQ